MFKLRLAEIAAKWFFLEIQEALCDLQFAFQNYIQSRLVDRLQPSNDYLALLVAPFLFFVALAVFLGMF